MVYKVYNSVVSVQSLKNTIISLGKLRENRESGGEPAAKRREERPPVASGTRWDQVPWRRGSEWFLKQLKTGVLHFPFCVTFRFNVPLWELGLRVQPLSRLVEQWTEIESPAVGTWHLWMTLCQAHPFSYHSQPSAMVATLWAFVWNVVSPWGCFGFSVEFQFSSVAQSCPTLCDPMNRSMPGLPVHHQLPEFTQTHVHRVGDAIQPSHPLSSPSPPGPISPSIRVFSNESTLRMRWPKYWSFSFSIIPSKEHPGLISFRIDWLDLLAVQGILKSLLQHHSSKASILGSSAFFTVQLSHPYVTTGKTIALTRRTFVGKVMSLLLNIPSRLFITFLPRSKHLLISWLQSPS